jgi:hypothetical protein
LVGGFFDSLNGIVATRARIKLTNTETNIIFAAGFSPSKIGETILLIGPRRQPAQTK